MFAHPTLAPAGLLDVYDARRHRGELAKALLRQRIVLRIAELLLIDRPVDG